ncbi:MAG: efflux RND transporter permease subunit [Myxococcota bacterium]
MWLVRVALRRPYTFVVMSLLIVILGVFTILRIPVDIFPDIDIPVITVVWNYGGLSPEEMEKRIVTNYERIVFTTVTDIEHIESQSLTGIAVVKIFLQQGASVDAAIAQITAVSQVAVRQMPPGATPPFIIRYSASNVPVLQVALESDTLSEKSLFDLGVNFLRSDLTTIKGSQIPYPYGGKQRQIMIDIDPERLYAWGLSAGDVNTALSLQNVILPTGSAKIGALEYPIVMNSSPAMVDEIGGLPIKTVRGKTVFIRDVANVRDGNSPQTSIVHVGGRRAALMPILKLSGASTLAVTSGVKATLPGAMAKLPKELKVSMLFDQSVFVRASIEGVVKEALIAAGLTALMMLLFLGSWRSTLIVVVSIPLSILTSIIVLGALGYTLNVMTLGGLALAVGILVDDATVAIENIHRNLGQKKPFIQSIVDGAQEIAVPAFVSTLCICIVFVPVAFITGAAKSLFVPMALAVVFAMMMSYFLSRTLVPTLVRYLLEEEAGAHAHPPSPAPQRFAARFHQAFNDRFDRLRGAYGSVLAWALARRGRVALTFLSTVALSLPLLLVIGEDFFPSVDAGLIKLHVRGPSGTRIEETERLFVAVTDTIKEIIPPEEIDTLLDNMGTPVSGINLSLSEGALISSADGQIFIALKPDHKPTANYVRALREKLRATYPECSFFFLAPDISTQVLNFGLPAPIDVQVVGPPGNEAQTFEVAQKIAAEVERIPGAVDVHLAQVQDRPQLKIDVDRTLASRVGMTQRTAASDVLVSLSSSGQVAPSFWLDPRGVQYLVAVQTPQTAVDSLDALRATPLATGRDSTPQLLSNVASFSRNTGPVNVTHFNAARTFDVQANVDGTDLGSVAREVEAAVTRLSKDFPRGTTVKIKGQVESMQSSFRGLAFGLLFAVLLVYLLMVVNFQSWTDPLIILSALPGAVAGILWMLLVSQTTLSVPALMGAIMCVGVATANSILVVTFANDQRKHGLDATTAALASGMTRLRPVLMTALAMVIGMLPMSLGLGEGGEQNAPLGRAVIGGLLAATFTTLFFVPVVYSLLRKKPATVDALVEEL